MMQEYAQGLIHVGNPPQKIEELPLLVPSPGNYDLKSQLFCTNSWHLRHGLDFVGQEIAELEELVKANDADAQFRWLICPTLSAEYLHSYLMLLGSSQSHNFRWQKRTLQSNTHSSTWALFELSGIAPYNYTTIPLMTSL